MNKDFLCQGLRLIAVGVLLAQCLSAFAAPPSRPSRSASPSPASSRSTSAPPFAAPSRPAASEYSTAPVIDPLKELLLLLEPIKGLSAKFTQDMMDAKGVLQQHNEGELQAQAPNHFYWETLEPFPQKIITDGKTLWVYDPDLEQVTIKPFSANYAKTPAMMFAGNSASIRDNFTVEKIAAKQAAAPVKQATAPKTMVNKALAQPIPLQEAQQKSFRLLPKKDQKDLFASLEMTFSSGKPVSMVINDVMQQKTTIYFSDVMLNPKIPVKYFSFTPPKDVTVLKTK